MWHEVDKFISIFWLQWRYKQKMHVECTERCPNSVVSDLDCEQAVLQKKLVLSPSFWDHWSHALVMFAPQGFHRIAGFVRHSRLPKEQRSPRLRLQVWTSVIWQSFTLLIFINSLLRSLDSGTYSYGMILWSSYCHWTPAFLLCSGLFRSCFTNLDPTELNRGCCTNKSPVAAQVVAKRCDAWSCRRIPMADGGFHVFKWVCLKIVYP